LDELAHELRGQGARAFVYAADVSDTTQMLRVAQRFAGECGGVDLVIANAGINVSKDEALLGNSASVARLMQTNVMGVTNTIVPFIPLMLRQGSGILAAVSSVAGLRGQPGRVAYSASKAAVLTFMSGLRLDLSGTRVHSMTLCPGFVRTPLTADLVGKLPFIMGVDDAVTQMARAIERRATTFIFPWQMRAMSYVIRLLPEALLRRMSPVAHGKQCDYLGARVSQ
jgi:short-subunit dehydrogenase